MANTYDDSSFHSTSVYIFSGICSLVLGILGWLSDYYHWFAGKDGIIVSILTFLLDLFDWKCFGIFGVCTVFALIGIIVDKKWDRFSYDLESPWWVAFSVAVALVCAVLIIPKLNSYIMIWEYGHEMGINTVYWDHDDALICSIRKTLMYGLSFLFIILMMRQWIRIMLLKISIVTRVLLGILMLPIYPAGAIALSYCLSTIFAFLVIGFVLYLLLRICGKIGEAKIAVDEAIELEQSNAFWQVPYASDAALRVLKDEPMAALQYDARKELERRKES